MLARVGATSNTRNVWKNICPRFIIVAAYSRSYSRIILRRIKSYRSPSRSFTNEGASSSLRLVPSKKYTLPLPETIAVDAETSIAVVSSMPMPSNCGYVFTNWLMSGIRFLWEKCWSMANQSFQWLHQFKVIVAELRIIETPRISLMTKALFRYQIELSNSALTCLFWERKLLTKFNKRQINLELISWLILKLGI